MISMTFQATLAADPVEDTKNTFQSKHVYLRLAGKMGAKDPENPQYKKTLFMQGSLWGSTAETALNSLKKGSRILVFADIYDIASNESNGKVFTNTSININRFEFLDARTGDNTAAHVSAPAASAMPQQQGGYASAVNMQATPTATNVQPPAWTTMNAGSMAANFF